MKNNRKLFSLLLTLALLCMQLAPAVTATAAETHTVSFDINIMEPGILTPPQQTVEDGDTADKPSDPSAFGCTFLGWYLGSSEYDFDTPVYGDITLKAEWDIGPEYYYHDTVVYNGTVSPYSARKGTIVTITADDPEPGKVFDKWDLTSGGVTLANEYDSTTTFEMQLEHVVVKATYKDAPVTYAITCDGAKAYSDSAKTIEITEAAAGATVYVKYETPTDDSKYVGAITFDGAYMSFTDYWNGIAMPDHAVSVSAVLVDRETYTIDLSSSSGTAAGVPWSVVFSNVPLFELSFYPTLPKEVDVDSDGTNDIYVTEETAGVTVSVEALPGTNLIATSYDVPQPVNRHYSKITYIFPAASPTYTVTFNSNGGNAANQTQTTGTDGKLTSAQYDAVSQVVSEAGHPDGKTFLGWNEHDSTTAIPTSDLPSIEYGADTTLFAVWGEPAVTEYKVWVGSTQVTSGNKDDILSDGGSAKYDPETMTLTLNNPTITGEYEHSKIYAAAGPVQGMNLTVKGKATLSGADYGIFVFGYSGFISNVHIDGADTDITAQGNVAGIYTNNGSAGITDGTVKATGGTAGIRAGYGNIYITGATAEVTAEATGYSGSGMDAHYTFYVEDGTVTAKSTAPSDSGSQSYSIKAGESVVIKGGTVNASSNSVGVDCSDISVSGGIVTSSGGPAFTTAPSLTDYPSPLVTVGMNESYADTWDGLSALNTFGYVRIEPGTPVTTYPLWVGSTQVTENNKDNILGDGKAAFDPATNTLTLNDPAITTLFNDGYTSAVICADGIDLIITGSATLENSSAQFGILCRSGNLTITGEITAKAEYSGISAIDDIIISGDSTVVTAEGGRYGIDTYHNISIQGGTVEATGTDASGSFGIFTESDAIEIKGSSTKVTATGKTSAVTAYSSAITIESPLSVVTPEGGSVSSDGKNIVGSDGTTVATHALIMPKEAPLPKVIGVKANVTGTEVSGGQCSVKAEGLEAVFESTAAPVTMNVGYLYTEQACSNILTTAPVPGTDYYFMLGVFGFTDGDPATLTWAANDVIKSGSAVTADNADVEIVELVHSPAGGSLSVIVKYTEKAVTPTVTHTVTFNANGHGTAPAAQTVEDGNTAAKPADPSETGWTFGGWYTEAACTTAYEFSASVTADITLYAKWTETSSSGTNTYTISYDLNGGTLDGKTGIVKLAIAEGTMITLPKPSRDGYEFDYWEGSRYNAGDSYKVEGNHTFTAQWKPAAAPANSPKTGDSSNAALWIVIMAAAASGIAFTLFRRRRYYD